MLCVVDVANLDTEEGVRQPALSVIEKRVSTSKAVETSYCTKSRLQSHIDAGRVCDQDCKLGRSGGFERVLNQNCKSVGRGFKTGL
jgi:hypothetical protein